MVVVKKKKGESDDRLIARFKKAALEARIVQDYRDRSRHKSASEKKKENKKRISHSIKQEAKRYKK